MQLSDRRLARRFSINVPLYISDWKSPAIEQKVESANISESGVYFETDAPPSEGTMLRVRLDVPREISGDIAVQWRCTGKVIRVQPIGSVQGVGVRFDYYEIY